jgi:phospholipase C
MSAKAIGPADIEHIVALVLENRSFDHMLGDLGRSGELPIDGGSTPMQNIDLNGVVIPINPVKGTVMPDLPHDFASVMTSIADNNGGFVRSDQLEHRARSLADAARVMSYFPSGTLPVTHALAREYSVCDRWFASVPTGTWPNRLFLVAGTSDGRVTNSMPTFLYDMPTVFDRLDSDAWKVYCDQIPNVTLFRSLAVEWGPKRFWSNHFRSLKQFYDECASSRLPFFSFIEPAYLGSAADDGHPPRDINSSEEFLGKVYSALRHSPLWPKSLLIVLYDEHGGFFDHVRPPTGVPSPDKQLGEYGFGFTTLGIRVPCLLVSPQVARGSVWRPAGDGFADHTSLIATVVRRVDADPLTARDEAAADVWSALTEPEPRTDDEATLSTIDRWLEGQQLVVTRDLGDPLDPERLEGMTGREVATAIIASKPVAGTQGKLPDEVVYRSIGELAGYSVPSAGRDVPLDVALVDLARAIVSLPLTETTAGQDSGGPATADREMAGGEPTGAA